MSPIALHALHPSAPRRLIPARTAFGKRLERALRTAGIRTMSEAAAALGYSVHTVTMWRRGDRRPPKRVQASVLGFLQRRAGP